MTARRIARSSIKAAAWLWIALAAPVRAQSPFVLPAAAIDQARAAAAEESKRPLSDRRPAGLEDLATTAAIQQEIDKSMRELGDSDFEVQGRAVHRLSYLGREALASLIQGLQSSSASTRKWCAVLLGSRGSDAVPGLIKALRDDPESYVRSAAASALGAISDPKAVPAMVEALQNPKSGEAKQKNSDRRDILQALGHIRSDQAFEALSEVLEDSRADSQLRYAAATSMLQISQEKGRNAIVAMQTSSDNPRFIHNLEAAKSDTGREQAWPPELASLFQLAKDARTLAGERFGEPEIAALASHLQSPDWIVRMHCLGALGSLRADGAVPAILATSGDKDMIFESLAEIASPGAIDAILKSVQSGKQEERMKAVGAMGSGGRWAVPVLVALLDDPSLRTTNSAKSSPPPPYPAWPDEHCALSALGSCLNRAGLRVEIVNLALSGASRSINEELWRAKEWWKDFGEDFMAGKTVSNPRLTFYLFNIG